jgi:hypothetical protein
VKIFIQVQQRDLVKIFIQVQQRDLVKTFIPSTAEGPDEDSHFNQ